MIVAKATPDEKSSFRSFLGDGTMMARGSFFSLLSQLLRERAK